MYILLQVCIYLYMYMYVYICYVVNIEYMCKIQINEYTSAIILMSFLLGLVSFSSYMVVTICHTHTHTHTHLKGLNSTS